MRDRQTLRQTDGQTDRQKQTERQADRQTGVGGKDINALMLRVIISTKEVMVSCVLAARTATIHFTPEQCYAGRGTSLAHMPTHHPEHLARKQVCQDNYRKQQHRILNTIGHAWPTCAAKTVYIYIYVMH